MAISDRRERRKTEPDQDRAGHRDGSAETRRAFEESADRERDQQQLKPAVLGDTAYGGLQRLERTFLDRQPIKKDDVEHDPTNREEACDGAQNRRTQRHIGRHRKDHDCDEIGDDQRDKCRDVSLHFVGRDQCKQRDDRQRGGASRQEFTVQRIVDLIPHWSLPEPQRAAATFCCFDLDARQKAQVTKELSRAKNKKLVVVFNYNLNSADAYDEGRRRVLFRIENNRYLSK